MIYIFISIFVISSIGLFIGLVSPSFIIRWKEQPNWFHVLGLFVPLIVVSYIMIALYPQSAVENSETVNIKENTEKVIPLAVEKQINHKTVKPKAEIKIPLLMPDNEKEEKFFDKNYQLVTNQLRKILKSHEIILYRGSITDYETHRVVKFKTNTTYEISMKITNTKQVQSIYIMMKKEKENLENIISSLLCSVATSNLTNERCSSDAKSLLVDLEKSQLVQKNIADMQNVIVRDSYYRIGAK